jgi:hypothetical protein
LQVYQLHGFLVFTEDIMARKKKGAKSKKKIKDVASVSFGEIGINTRTIKFQHIQLTTWNVSALIFPGNFTDF